MRRAVAIATVAALAAGCAAAPRTARSPAPPVAGAAPLYGIVQDRAGRFVACAPCPGPTPKTPAAAAPRRPLAAGRPSLPARREPRRAQARPEQNRKKAVVVTAKRTDASFGPQPFHVVQFAFGKHEVPARERRRLVELAAQIEGRVLVTGYTDDIGPKAYNDWLARERAVAVARVLAEAGIDPGRIEVRGEGKCCYVATNETREGRARNRRAELRLAPERDRPQA